MLEDLPFDSSIHVPKWKRILDIAVMLLGMPFLLPMMLLIAVCIRMVSVGPVLFRQQRVGYLGKFFTCFKFRTMHVNADTSIHQDHATRLMDSNLPMVKMDAEGDPRIIPFGKLLRSSGLDELPQILNVLRGEMSLVGPRPCVLYEYQKYLGWQKERFNTLPGLTGLWQVKGKNRTTFEEMVLMDIDYCRNKTLWTDLKIMVMTIPALLIQMRDTRRGRKMLSSPASSKPNAV
jgi:lipopolysaccharide/colanic/teichoic acid biosynthesis glycosyltransferase